MPDRARWQALEKHRLLRVGFVFQRFFLLPMLTAWENIELPQAEAGAARAVRRARTEELLELASEQRPVNVTFRTHADGVKLSIGLKSKYPDDMTIILQHDFEQLNIKEDRFEARLSRAAAYQLLQTRGDVAGAASGSGLAEAIERMNQLAGLANRIAASSASAVSAVWSRGWPNRSGCASSPWTRRHWARSIPTSLAPSS